MKYTAYFFASIVNDCLRLAYFPEIWKISAVVPIEKIINTTRPEELRSINTLPSDEKILESIVKEQLLEFLNQHDIIINQQSCFRAKHSCETALNMVVADWKDLVAVFLDLKRAFETVDRCILLIKLKRIGITRYINKMV